MRSLQMLLCVCLFVVCGAYAQEAQ
ncbi:MAG: hypothetical protein RIT40_2125, partial [Planctomycetota bacterium]